MLLGRARTTAALAASLVALCSACASSPAPGPPALPASRPSHAVPPRAATPAQGSYGPEPQTHLAPIEQRLLDVARASLGGDARPSGALSVAARELAGRAAAGDPAATSGPASREVLARALCYDPSPTVYSVRARPEDASDALARLLPVSGATHVGAGAVEQGGVLYAFVLASVRRAALEPFPRETPLGSAAVLSGELARGLRAARVFVTLPSGDVREVDTAADGSSFRAPIAFARARPVHGRGDRGRCARAGGGGAAHRRRRRRDRRAAFAHRGGPPEPDDPAAAEAAIVRAMNETRRGRGLRPSPPRRRSCPSRAVTAQRCATLRRWRTSCPGRARSGDRLRRAGIPYRFAYENVAQGPTALAAHARTSRRARRTSRTSSRRRRRSGWALPARALPIGGAGGLRHRDPRSAARRGRGERAHAGRARARGALARARAAAAHAAHRRMRRSTLSRGTPPSGCGARRAGRRATSGRGRSPAAASPRWTCSWRAPPRRRSARATCRTRVSSGSAWAWPG